ncbi:tetratricopeptide repeat domain protein [Calothrix sp. NIES-4071]|nr:tetratricopeptide repeat domain protein [Calothrix sp. NIES-4071]BAZ54808.1 tetratricopeptide repeat domain protein [Calothrix sp. NIES-4105]
MKLRKFIYLFITIFLIILLTNYGAATSTVSTSIANGQVFYSTGLYQEAARVWINAVRRYENNNDKNSQGLMLSYLALAYQQNGQLQQAQFSMAEAKRLINHNGIINQKIGARVFNNEGELLFNQGNTEAALNAFQQATQYYQASDDVMGVIGTQLNSARALQMLGYFLRAKSILEQIQNSLSTQPNSEVKVTALINLGNLLRVTGEYKRASEVSMKSYDIATKMQLHSQASVILLNLGRLAEAQSQLITALEFYQRAAQNNSVKLQASVYMLKTLVHLDRYHDAQKLLTQIYYSLLPGETLNQTKVYALIELASDLIKMRSLQESSAQSDQDYFKLAAQLLTNAYKDAQTLGNPRAESIALGRLASLYEQTKQWQNAIKLTQQALDKAISLKAADIAYQWEWQLGRLFKLQGDINKAITNYTEAYHILQSLRQDLVAINQDIQFSFRESVEPVYRELVDLLLQNMPDIDIEQQQANLTSAREIIEALQMAELANYFRQACINGTSISIEQIDASAAVIYPILLKDRLEVVLSLPNQPLRHYATLETAANIENAIKRMRHSQRRTSFERERLLIAGQLYNWLVKPADEVLTKHHIKTLVFVLDGSLRNVPMAALHDGTYYLIEKFQIAVAPNLQLFKAGVLSPGKIKVLAGGISLPLKDSSPLPGVEQEIKSIRALVPTTVLLNQNFTLKNIRDKLSEPYSVIHLATHGQFSSNSTDTYIQTWNEQLDINMLTSLIADRNIQGASPIELLILSACQTAKGDDSAALGIAGVAAHSGARSVLASLWQINDESTPVFMNVFYKKLYSGAKKAEALQKAQIELLRSKEYKHPYHWASFILVGNWL